MASVQGQCSSRCEAGLHVKLAHPVHGRLTWWTGLEGHQAASNFNTFQKHNYLAPPQVIIIRVCN